MTSTGPVPFTAEEEAEFDKMEADFAAKKADYAANHKYKDDRAAEYPSFADQFDLIYHSGIDAWKAKIKETKDKFPKPE
tara:strand:+ start:82 stop:318 length:237 start_codon:yes stop_codon:yes gene_type:complete